jgi:hypothetical protein
MRQAGHPELWLCSIFANLTDDLAAALRDAWFSSMILRRQATHQAENSAYNRMRRALVGAVDEAEVTIMSPFVGYSPLGRFSFGDLHWDVRPLEAFRAASCSCALGPESRYFFNPWSIDFYPWSNDF